MARPRQITDEDIVEATRSAFKEHGPGTSVAQVAERLGVSQAALFHRAGSKAELMRIALAPTSPRTLEALRRGPIEGEPIVDQLGCVLGELAAFFRELVPSLVALRVAGMPLDDGREPMPLVLRRALASWLRKAEKSGAIETLDASAVAESLLGALEARGFNAHVGGDRFAPGSDATVVRKLVRALVTPKRRSP